MGFFRQWLHYQEVDQQLRTQLALREQELAQIQAQTESLTHDTSYTKNTLLLALLASMRQPASDPNTPSLPTSETSPPIEYDRTRLEKQLNAYAAIDAQQNTPTTRPPSRYATSDLTDPQLKIPWWLRNSLGNTQQDEQATNPIDQNSTRTDALVQRWFSRWGNQVDKLTEDQEERKS
jgi:hypothetical protein